MGTIEIQVKNWDEFNPRADVKKSSWFRLDHNIFDHPKFTELTGPELFAWVYILAMASNENKNGAVTIYPAHAVKSRIDEGSLFSAVEKLNDLKVIEYNVTSTNAHDRVRTDTCPTRRTDETDETGRDGTPAFRPADLRELWNSNCGPLPKCKTLGRSREDKARAQIKLYPDRTHWVDALKKFTSSRFCTEEWLPGFDDWLNESKRIRAVEGKYDGTARGSPKTFQQQTFDANKEAFFELEGMKNAEAD